METKRREREGATTAPADAAGGGEEAVATEVGATGQPGGEPREGTVYASHHRFAMFADLVKHTMRYVLDDATRAFLDAICRQAKECTEIVPAGKALWRAQIVVERTHAAGTPFDDALIKPYPPARMRPLADRAHEGRANPKGIPYLYTATRRRTAIAEARPDVGSYVSVAQFCVLRPLRIVNCTVAHIEPHPPRQRDVPAETRSRIVWSDIDRAFSAPVTVRDDAADYAPTQILAEQFKRRGYDGVAYRSALGDGHNIVVFDLASLGLANCRLDRITDVLPLSSVSASGRYFASEGYPDIFASAATAVTRNPIYGRATAG